jgi:alpha-glucosidase
VAYLPEEGYAPYENGKALDVWLKAENGTESLGVVWPGTCLNRYYSIRI